jgi:hypothetical protein
MTRTPGTTPASTQPANGERASVLHAPVAHGQSFKRIERQVPDEQPDDDHRRQPGEHTVCVKRVAVLEDVLAETTLPRARAEYPLRREKHAT